MKDPSEKLEILVVDDEAGGREALAELLSNEGYTVVCAENGRRFDDAGNEWLGIPRAAKA